MSAKLLVLYHPPKDPAAFEKYYVDTHVPIAKKIPGIRSYTINAKPVGPVGGGDSPYFLVAELEFDSIDAIGAGFSSPEGQAAAADVPNFATGGVTMLTYEIKPV